MPALFALLFLGLAVAIGLYLKRERSWKLPKVIFPKEWRTILTKHVNFYGSLLPAEKERFEYRVQEFLLNHRITGVGAKIDDTDRVMVAASGVIPIFHFPDWRYSNLYEVLIYPAAFDMKFNTTGPGRTILGMVGDGPMQGMMLLSQKALRHGFRNESDKRNTAIHEFVHLIDKMDGAVDGLPELLIEQPYIIPWLDLIRKKIKAITNDKSDIRQYGGTSEIEFFAVAAEYFFERPKLLKKKHPQLYAMMEDIFDHDLAERDLENKRKKIGRNSRCPCGSGQKFKRCCGSEHFS